jgi:hypothetical protein
MALKLLFPFLDPQLQRLVPQPRLRFIHAPAVTEDIGVIKSESERLVAEPHSGHNPTLVCLA